MLSYVRGPEAAVSDLSIYATFRETVRRYPGREAFVSSHQGQRFTWAELSDAVEATARGVSGLGLTPGDRIGIWSLNCTEWVLLQLAAARSGIVLVNINPAYRSHELSNALQRSGIRAIFLHEKDDRSSYRDILANAEQAGETALQHRIWLGTDSWTAFLEAGIPLSEEACTCDDVANIQYTSGTTGLPKGVLLTHRNLVNNGRFIAQWLRVTEADRICVPVPLYHCFGCVIGTMVSISTGAAMILPSARFRPQLTLAAIDQERCTIVYGVPAMFIAQINDPSFGQYDFSTLRTGIMSGAPCPIEVMKRVVTDMHCSGMTIVYGQTETSPVITGVAIDDDLERRVSTVGVPLPGTEVKLIDRSTGGTVEIGERGEVCTRGYLVMKGYDNDPEATRAVIDDEEWLHTGDVGVLRPDGYLNITGRARDLIIRGGENIYPREVESFLFTHPDIADVEVVGIPDAKLGETVCAWIRLREGSTATAEDIRAFCRDRISHFKIPYHIRFVEDFPRTVTGKSQKYLIRKQEIELQGLEGVATQATA